MKEQLYKIVLFTFFLFFFSCNDKKNISTNKTSSENGDTTIKYLPRDKNGQISKIYTEKYIIEKQIGIADLSLGYDSIFIRLLYGFVETDSTQIVEIFYDKKNEKWHSNVYNIDIDYTPTYDSILSVKKQITSSIPKSGWEILLNKLNSLNICYLPDYHDINNYNLPMDGSSIVVQVATKKSYRMYTYVSPGINKKIIEAQKICEILKIIEYELSFKQLGVI